MVDRTVERNGTSEAAQLISQTRLDASALPKNKLDRLIKLGYAPANIPAQLQHIIYEREHPEDIPVIDAMVNNFIDDLQFVLSEEGNNVSAQVAQGLISLSMNRRFLASA